MFAGLLKWISTSWDRWTGLFSNIPLGDPFLAVFALLVLVCGVAFFLKFAHDYFIEGTP